MATSKEIAHTISMLTATWASLSALGAELIENQWKMETQLPAWSVKDNLSHLVGFESGLQGLVRAKPTTADKSHVKNPIGDTNEDEVDQRRSLSGSQVLAQWNSIVQQRLSTMRSADATYFDENVDTPAGPGTIFDLLQLRILDSWIHEQDMRRTVGMPGNNAGPSADHTIDRLIRTIPIVVGKRAGTPEGGTVVIVITGAVQRTVACTVVQGRAQLSSEIGQMVLATITMDSDAFLQLATGRASHHELVTSIAIAGDTELGTKVVSQFNMMI